MSAVIRVENVSKLYNLQEVGVSTIKHDLIRWWARMQGKEDPAFKLAEVNDRGAKGESNFVWALKDINFEIKQGEVLGIIGKNGSGKSTLLKLLSRVAAPTTGNIRMKGRLASLLEVGTGFHPDLSGRDNIYLNGSIFGMSRSEIKRNFDRIVDFSGVERYIDTPVKRYSSGMYVRLAFSVAVHLQPEILIVDEVLSVGDYEFQKKCMDKMKDVIHQGKTVLFVSHNAMAVKDLCTRILLLENGQSKYQGEVDKGLYTYFGYGEKDYSAYEKSWPLESCPKNETIVVTSIQIRKEDGTEVSTLTISKPFQIIIKFKVLKENTKPNFSISIHASGDEALFGSIVVTEDMRPTYSGETGDYQVSCLIPENLMNSGSYYVNVNGYGAEFTDHFGIVNPIGFEIHDDGTDRKGYKGGFAGFFRPKINWSVKKSGSFY